MVGLGEIWEVYTAYILWVVGYIIITVVDIVVRNDVTLGQPVL